MDALPAWMESDLDVIMVATMDALRAWMLGTRMGSECGVTSGSRAKPRPEAVCQAYKS